MCKVLIDVYTVADLQQIFSCSKPAVYRLLKSPSFPSFKVNRRYYVRLADLERWIDRQLGKYAV